MSIKHIRTIILVLVCATALTTSNVYSDKVTAQPIATQQSVATDQSQDSTPLAIVASPKSYLGKTVTFNAKFDKFATLGLDYKPAFKSSEEYISFLIKRDDTIYDIPLSKMKLSIAEILFNEGYIKSFE